MSNEIDHAGAEHAASYLYVWIGLLALTAVEVVLAYMHLFSTGAMLAILMALSVVKAGLIVAYFMHLRFERMSLIISLVPTIVIVICLLLVFFPDSFRLSNLRVR